MIVSNINVSKILKEHLFVGKHGKYLDLVLFDNKAGRDQYGNDGFVTQSLSKAAREAGARGPIIGNWKRLPDKTTTAAAPDAAAPDAAAPDAAAPKAPAPEDTDDVIF